MKKSILPAFITLFVLVMAACNTSRKASGNASIQKRWNISYIDSVSDAKVLASQAFIDFSVPGKGGAKAGCNQLFFSFKLLAKDSLDLSQLGSTMMMCPEMEPETMLSRWLPMVDNYQINDSVLILRIGDKAVIRAH